MYIYIYIYIYTHICARRACGMMCPWRGVISTGPRSQAVANGPSYKGSEHCSSSANKSPHVQWMPETGKKTRTMAFPPA